MVVVRYGIAILVFAPPVLAIFLLTIGQNFLEEWLSRLELGSWLSYYSLLFSLYAALEVKNISNKYFFKLRSPDVRKKLLNISRQINSFSAEPSESLRSQTFIPEAAVAIRAAKRMKNGEVKKVAKDAEKALSALRRVSQNEILDANTAGKVSGYWELHEKLTELADELKTQVDDLRAIQ